MNENYCSYELSKALKACGFDEPCIAQWACEPDGKPILVGSTAFVFSNAELKGRDVTAPLLFHAQKWLREKKGIAINVIAHDRSDRYVEGKYHWSEAYLPNFKESGLQWADWFIYGKHPLFDTYEEALSDGLNQMLQLIEKGE